MQKKTLFRLAFICATILSISANGQTWYWTKQADSSNSQLGTQDAVDRNDNIYYTGYATGTRMAFGNTGIYLTGVQDDFLAKYNDNGTFQWARDAKSLNPSSQVWGTTVATDPNNNVVEAGYFTDSIAFGTYHLHSVSSNYNTYTVKYDRNGNVLWATSPKASVTTNCENQAYTAFTDKMSNVLVTGIFVDTAYFGATTLSAVGTDMYIVKYSAAGAVLWAKTATLSGGSNSWGLSVVTDDSDNVYVAGNISGTVTFGSTPALTGSGTVYLVKYDSTGKAKWSLNTTATPGSEWPTPITCDRTQHIYLGAQFNNPSITFGPSTVTDTYGPCSNSLLVKYDRNGNPIWAICADNISSPEVCTIVESGESTDKCNDIYWSGICSDTFGIGSVKVTVPGGGTHPSRVFAYVMKIDSNGNPIAGAAIANQNSNSFSNYVAVDSLSKAYLVSELDNPATVVIGSDTVFRYLSNSTCFLSKFAVVPAISNGNNHDTICKGDSITLGLSPIPGSTFTWSNGKTTDSITVKPLTTTTYFVAINNGCIIDTSFVKVTVMSLSDSIHGTDSICKGDTALLVGYGGGTYLWSNGKTTSSIKVAPLINTTYTVTIKNGPCTKDTTYTVHVSPLPVPSIVPVPADSVCKGDSVLLNGSGGTTYVWSNGKTTSSIWVSPLINTTYTLYAHGSITCADSTELTIRVLPLITAAINAVNDTVCPHGITTITATASGGNATYKWSNGATTSSITVSDTVTTTYTVTVYGTCDSIKEIKKVTVIPLPKPVISGAPVKCKGVKDTLIVNSSINPTTYTWGNGKTSDTLITGPINGDSTIYVTAKNSLGCLVTDSFKITERQYPGGNIKYTPSCGTTPTLITAIPTGTGPFTFQWSTGGTNDTINVIVPNDTTYTVVISNGCPITKTVTIIPAFPSLNACCNGIINIGGDTTISANGNGIIKYQWADSIGIVCLNPPLCDSIKVSPTVTTTYTVTGTDSKGCSTQQIVTIVVETPCFNPTIPNVFTPSNPGALGLDSKFYIKTTDISSWSILIYDRWGKEMFKSTNPIDYWNGNTESGGKAPAGIYYYLITGTCQNNTYKKDGYVQLIR